MRNRRKGLIPSQSADDADIYRLIYYGYTSEMQMKVEVNHDVFVKKNHLLATMISEGK